MNTKYLHRGLKLKHLHLITALLQYHNVTLAAQSLNVTQPAVSRSLAELEAGLGVRLFDRNATGLEPTAFGSCLINHASTILGELERAEQDFESIANGQKNRLALGGIAGTTLSLLPTLIAMTKQRMPELSISAQESAMELLLAYLRSSRIDIAVGTIPDGAVPADIDQVRIYDDELVVVTARSHALSNCPALNWNDLLAYTWIVPSKATKTRLLIEETLRRKGFQIPEDLIESVSADLTIGLLNRIEAIAFLPERRAEIYRKKDVVRILPVRLPRIVMPVSAFLLKERRPTRGMDVFLECLLNFSGDGA
ncbi:LysR family transcriptional regulator [Noviherbaspirillum pedocola]|uniref:LysR family transcriptional regulator n=1 Tax=Noviherbaspirillum pedocola TaxID=2801341 RepID=A0A934T4B6_9BURK|nr:LysR family transcriptional regulator [Noviherbaspirillum pedocola]MBK4739313.1 LysR family transcriptional regulator [Noviherbaspirillum pedocola]